MVQQFICPNGHQWAPHGDGSTGATVFLIICPECGTPGKETGETAKDSQPKTPESSPRQIGRFQILAELGRGKRTVIYKARDAELNRLVAIKTIGPGETKNAFAQECLLREGRFLAALLQKPNIVELHSVGEHNGDCYLQLELLEGGNLAQRLKDAVVVPAEAAELVKMLALAIQSVHERGIVHCDLKPTNVLMTAAGIPKITDFGFARQIENAPLSVDTSALRNGLVQGTPSFLPPELAGSADKEIGPGADIYGLGAILYRLVTGLPPFQGATPMDIVLQVVTKEPTPPTQLQPTLPEALEIICLKCLAKDVRQRYQSAKELADDLDRFLKKQPIRGVLPEREHPSVSQRRNLAVVVSLWEKVTGKIAAHTLDHPAAALAITLSPDRRITLTGYADDRARLWDTGAGKPIGTALEHKGPVIAVAMAPDSRIAATGSEDQTARLWNAFTGQPISPPLQHFGPVTALAFSPDGKMFLTGSADNTARVWDTGTGKPISPPLLHIDRVRAVAFGRDGRNVLTGSRDGSARLWQTGTAMSIPLDHGVPVSAVSFGPDNSILTISEDHAVRLWKFVNGTPSFVLLRHQNRVCSAEFYASGRMVLTCSYDRSARLWETATGRPIGIPLQHEGIVVAGSFSLDGRFVLTGSREDVHKAGAAAIGRTLAAADEVMLVVCGSEGNVLMTGAGNLTARLWELSTGKLVARVLQRNNQVFAITYKAGAEPNA